MANYKDKVSTILVKKLYPIVAESLSKNTPKLMDHINKFFNRNHRQIYDISTYDNIYYNQTDIDDLFRSVGLTEVEVLNIIKQCYFYSVPINPQCVKEPYIEFLLMAVRYYIKSNKRREAEIVGIYLTFSGKFYASIFADCYPTAPPSKYRSVMDYVVNNMLTDKYDLKRYGTVFGAIKSMVITWLDTYEKQIKSDSSDDETCKMLIQQIRDRLKSFMHNIMKLYYEAYQSKAYMNYETDSEVPEEFRLADNDAAKAARLTENTLNYMTTNKVSLEICNRAHDKYVKATELCSIIEGILSDNNNLPDLKRCINIIICDYLRKYPNGNVKSIEFVSYSIKAKPNTRDKYLMELKDILSNFLDQNSIAYRRKSEARKASYYKSLLTYLVLLINKIAT